MFVDYLIYNLLLVKSGAFRSYHQKIKIRMTFLGCLGGCRHPSKVSTPKVYYVKLANCQQAVEPACAETLQGRLGTQQCKHCDLEGENRY